MDSVIDTISEWIGNFFQWIGRVWSVSIHCVDILPPVLTVMIYIAFYLALFGILMTHIRAIILNRNKWKEKYGSGLTFSYFCGTGQYQRTYIYKDAHTFLLDKTWLLISAAGMAYHLGKYESESQWKVFLLSLVHIPLVIIGIPEMLFRAVFGWIYLVIANIMHWAVFVVLNIATTIVTPIWNIIDCSMRIEQHCPHCYMTFRVPGYVCPSCGKIHKDLIPGKTGILVARCECDKFLPSALITGRSRLDGVCPKCEKALAVAGAKEFTLQLIGGNTSGRTAYLAAFQHMYRETNKNADSVQLLLFPKERFDDLEKMFMNGVTQESSKTATVTYSIVHDYSDGSKDNLVIYDIPDEVLMSGVYEQNPLNFAYSNGILVILDPTAIRSVRAENEKKGQRIPDGSYSDSEAEIEDIIIEFIQQFSRLSNRSSSRKIKIPVAVIINKIDLKAVNGKIGRDAISYKFESNPDLYNGDYSIARNKICRDYIVSLGMYNTINNLESVFSNVQYFAASAMGHIFREGMPFAPVDVIEPIAWIAEKNNSKLSSLLKVSHNMVNGEEFEDKTTSKALEERYKNAEKLLVSNEFEKAEAEFKLLGDYRDSAKKVESITELRYQFAKALFSKGKFDEADKEFTSIKGYKDSKNYAMESALKVGESALERGDYEKAINVFGGLGSYKGANRKLVEAKYQLANQKVLKGDPEGALADYNALGEYKDAKSKARRLMPELIKNGSRRNLAFGEYKWRVLKVENSLGIALIVTETIVGRAAYHNKLMGVVWKDCSIRNYLNTEFLYDFDDEEKKIVTSMIIKNERNSEYGTVAGEDTTDAVFLLSSSEMKELFTSDKDRMPLSGGVDARWCWLRSPGGNNSYAAIVDSSGAVSDGGNAVNNADGGIRPAMWINL